MSALLSKILPVRSNELRPFAFCFAINFLLGITYVVGNSVTDALFLKNFGAEYLSVMFTINAVLLIALFPLYNYLNQKFDAHKTFQIMLGFFGVALAGLGFVLLSTSTTPKLIYPILLSIFAIYTGLIFTHFTTYLVEFFDTLQSKRLLSPIFGALILGTAVGGFLISILISLGNNSSNLIFLWAGTLLLLILLVNFNRTNATLQKGATEEEAGFWQSLKENFGIWRGSRLITFTLVAALLSDLVISGASIMSRTIFAHAPEFPTAEKLMEFYGTLEVWIAIIAFVIQFVIVPRLVGLFGVGSLNLILPFLLLITFGGMSVTGISVALLFAIFARFNVNAVYEYVEPTANNLILNALAPRKKSRVLAFSGGVIEPIGPIITGLLLTFLTGLFSTKILALIFFGLTGLYFLISYLQNRAYTRELISLIESQNFDLFKSAAISATNLNEKVFVALEKNLRQTDLDRATISAQLLADLRGITAVPTFLEVYPNVAPELKLTLLPLLARIAPGNEQAEKLFLTELQNPEVRFRSVALRNLDVITLGKQHLPVIENLLRDTDPTIRMLAAVFTIDHAEDHVAREQATRVILHLLAEKNSEILKNNIANLTHLKKPTPEILKALFMFPEHEHVLQKRIGKTLLAWIHDREDWRVFHSEIKNLRARLFFHIRELRHFALVCLDHLDELTTEELATLLGDRAKHIREIARTIALRRKSFSSDHLQKWFQKSENPFLWESATLLWAAEKKSDPEALSAIVLATIEHSANELSRLTCLSRRYRNNPKTTLLLTVCRDRFELALATALHLLTEFSDAPIIGTIRKNIVSHSARLRASAIEGLEHLPFPESKKISRLLDPLTAPLPYEERLSLFAVNCHVKNCKPAAIFEALNRSADPWEQSIAEYAKNSVGDDA